MVSMAEEVKYISYLSIVFSMIRFFFNQVLLSRIVSGLAIYLQNDLNFSENITLTVHKDMSFLIIQDNHGDYIIV